MAVELNTRRALGRRLTYREVDDNWDAIEAILNSLNLNAAVTVTQTLEVGDNEITHDLGASARFVSFFKSDGTPTNYTWVRHPDYPQTKIVVTVPGATPEEELADTEIDVLSGINNSRSKTIVQTFVEGANPVAHNLGAKARFVGFFLSDSSPTNYTWQRDPEDPDNKIIVTITADTPAEELLNNEINIVTT